jgi:uncharacterized protein
MRETTILFFGKTGVGKSSTLNKLFDLNLATDNSIACTKSPQNTYLEKHQWENLESSNQRVQVVDMPGIGESITADEKYMSYYEEWIPKTHVLVWITQADTRAYKRDELFLLKLMPLFQPSIFLIVALNKIDCLGVDEGEQPFNTKRGKPSEYQLKIMDDKINDVYEIFKEVVGKKLVFERNQVVPYTSVYGWGLQNLKEKMMVRI